MKSPVTDKVKEIVHRYDADVELILFGSRARGDFGEESDWDFLVLTESESVYDLDKKIRADVYYEIELVTFDSIQTIVRNKKVWREDLWMTPLFRNVSKEGVLI